MIGVFQVQLADSRSTEFYRSNVESTVIWNGGGFASVSRNVVRL